MEREIPTRRRKSAAVAMANALQGSELTGIPAMPRNERSKAIWNITIITTAIPRAMSISGYRSGTWLAVMKMHPSSLWFVMVPDKNWFSDSNQGFTAE